MQKHFTNFQNPQIVTLMNHISLLCWWCTIHVSYLCSATISWFIFTLHFWLFAEVFDNKNFNLCIEVLHNYFSCTHSVIHRFCWRLTSPETLSSNSERIYQKRTLKVQKFKSMPWNPLESSYGTKFMSRLINFSLSLHDFINAYY